MNEYDKENLDFFLHGDQQEFDEWLEQAETSDIEYALRLVREAKEELLIREYSVFDNVPFLHEAKNLLNQFTKKY